MKNLVALATIVFVCSCTSTIKDQKSAKENPAVDTTEVVDYRPHPTEVLTAETKEDLIGYWVGWFVADLPDSTESRYYREGIQFSEQNKINISIDSISGSNVFGHSVVANNYQVFSGTIEKESGIFTFRVKEPTEGKHDGEFLFQINERDSIVRGYWQAYNPITVSRRKFSLKKRIFEYNPNVDIESWFADYSKTRSGERTVEEQLKRFNGNKKDAILDIFYDMDLSEASTNELDSLLKQAVEEHNLYTDGEYYTVTSKFSEYNSSRDVLSEDFVAELSKADIYVMRNSIYARHGYSFKDKTLRAFFDQMHWYMPVHANIKSDLTEIEKKNIQLLLKYEEHAEEYYDEFGR